MRLYRILFYFLCASCFILLAVSATNRGDATLSYVGVGGASVFAGLWAMACLYE